ncbi:hypothetical protein TVAG_375890 [Trichomonas vaginalis G3]|uniref:Thioredoxin domain-containing protein n=1 Tax=Trichomonas vaginalis (strain ATCC PRA-98 / G3) TaxID=412133 RepID=A2G1M1_TRIV3|nr:protein disulfide isomerase family [Trichomonas vaginalis G3]EAX88941.1 hypothetical protein TVAG_375890 [Trichomonas vaginalis G3]KAI5535802.1 protein disulfide isomerase family [Trichomonas vaginalis G3]|eukprot:XP_001301871.1 hypothetical protein [Trichomonas vaginalis G3]
MIFSFLCLSLCVNRVKFVDNKEFRNLTNTHDTVVALILSEDSDHFWQYCEVFSHSVEIGANATFVVVTELNAPKAYRKYTMSEPCYSFFFNHSAVFATRASIDLEILKHVLTASLLRQPIKISTVEEFNANFDAFPYTIISTEEHMESAHSLYIKHSFSKGPLGYCQAPASFFEKVGCNPQNYILYRKSEETFAEFNGTDNDLNRAAQNLLNYEIDRNTMILSERNIVTVIHDGDAHPIVPFLPVARRHISNLYGYLDEDAYSFIIGLLSNIQAPKPYLTVLNFTGLWVSEPLLDLSEEKIEEYVTKVEKNEVKKIYTSEPVNETEEYKLVGTNYEEFLKNDEKDTLIFYISSYNMNESIPMVNNYNSYAKSHNINARVAYIDYLNNSCSLGFPQILYQPHCQFFPAKNYDKSVHVVISGTIHSILRFFKEKGHNEINLEGVDRDDEVEKKFIMDNIFYLSLEDKPVLKQLLEEYTAKYGILSGIGTDYNTTTRVLFKGIRGVIDNEDEFEDGDVPGDEYVDDDDYYYYEEDDAPKFKPKASLLTEEL